MLVVYQVVLQETTIQSRIISTELNPAIGKHVTCDIPSFDF